MKKLLIAMAMMSAMAMAQTSSTQSDTSATSDATKSTTHKHKKSASSDASAMPESDKSMAAAKDKTVEGCLHKDGDNYWLKTGMAKMGSKYHVMSSQDLSAHDGHKVKITGKVSKGPLPGSSKEVRHLEASNVEMVSDKCAMGTGMKKKDEMKNDEMKK